MRKHTAALIFILFPLLFANCECWAVLKLSAEVPCLRRKHHLGFSKQTKRKNPHKQQLSDWQRRLKTNKPKNKVRLTNQQIKIDDHNHLIFKEKFSKINFWIFQNTHTHKSKVKTRTVVTYQLIRLMNHHTSRGVKESDVLLSFIGCIALMNENWNPQRNQEGSWEAEMNPASLKSDQ